MGLRSTLKTARRPLFAALTRKRLQSFIERHATAAFTLDLGASTGPYAALFPNRIALDLRHAPGVQIVGDGHALPFRSACFDQIVATEVLEHMMEPQRAVDEMFRVLRPGGRLLLTTRFLFPIHDAPHDYFRFTCFGLRHLLRAFEIESLEEETDAVGTLAVLAQRIGFQAETLGWRPFRLAWLVLAQGLRPLSFLITREYGEHRGRRAAPQRMMTSGYYAVCRRPLDSAGWARG
jgi:SAM-dependent methyltransferase